MRKNRKGQEMIEYLILLVVMIVLFLYFFAPGGRIRQALNRSYEAGIDSLTIQADALGKETMQRIGSDYKN